MTHHHETNVVLVVFDDKARRTISVLFPIRSWSDLHTPYHIRSICLLAHGGLCVLLECSAGKRD